MLIGFLKSLFSAVSEFFRYLGDGRLIDAGKAEQSAKQAEEVQNNVKAAQDAISTPDPVRDERLQNRFDRSRK